MKPSKGLLGGLVGGLALGATITALALKGPGRVEPEPIYISPPAPTPTPAATATPEPLRIYVSGEVERPDVYELPAGSIVRDVLEMAGGFTDSADGDLLNLALPLSDGMHIRVPAEGDPSSVPVVSGPSTTEQGFDSDAATIIGPVNINTAGRVELETLPGIGPNLAQRIIDYRIENGPFAEIADIMKVSGIGPAKFEQIQEMITVR